MTPPTPPTDVRDGRAVRRGAQPPHMTDARWWVAYTVLFGVALALIHLL